jgi:hypothetical protein
MINLPFYPGLSFQDNPRIILKRYPFCHEGIEGQHKVVHYKELNQYELWVKTTHGFKIHDQELVKEV